MEIMDLLKTTKLLMIFKNLLKNRTKNIKDSYNFTPAKQQEIISKIG